MVSSNIIDIACCGCRSKYTVCQKENRSLTDRKTTSRNQHVRSKHQIRKSIQLYHGLHSLRHDKKLKSIQHKNNTIMLSLSFLIDVNAHIQYLFMMIMETHDTNQTVETNHRHKLLLDYAHFSQLFPHLHTMQPPPLGEFLLDYVKDKICQNSQKRH